MNPASSADALSQLQQAQSQAQDPNTILSNQQKQLGVDAAQNTVTGLRGAINNTTKLLQQVAPSVMGRTANSLVTNAQATRQIGNEQAPISQNLNQESTNYNQANADLQNLEQKAQTAASGIYQGQQDKLSFAQNLYNTLYQKERDAQAAQEAEAARQEQARQFNEQLAASRAKSAASAGVNPSIEAGSGPKALSQRRSDGGYNFQDTSGNAISAAKYAQLTGQNVMDVLLRMGQGGDKFAAQTYNQLKKNPKAARPSAIFWGT